MMTEIKRGHETEVNGCESHTKTVTDEILPGGVKKV